MEALSIVAGVREVKELTDARALIHALMTNEYLVAVLHLAMARRAKRAWCPSSRPKSQATTLRLANTSPRGRGWPSSVHALAASHNCPTPRNWRSCLTCRRWATRRTSLRGSLSRCRGEGSRSRGGVGRLEGLQAHTNVAAAARYHRLVALCHWRPCRMRHRGRPRERHRRGIAIKTCDRGSFHPTKCASTAGASSTRPMTATK